MIESIKGHIDVLVNNAAYTDHAENVLDATEDLVNKYDHLNFF